MNNGSSTEKSSTNFAHEHIFHIQEHLKVPMEMPAFFWKIEYHMQFASISLEASRLDGTTKLFLHKPYTYNIWKNKLK